MTVRRTLPTKGRTLIGAWCFADHYGPDDVAQSGGMDVPPHPHTGLQTVSWLFSGEIEHRDSIGSHAIVRPGELNLMTAGRGISHSEVSTPNSPALHGMQLWVALPGRARFTAPNFEHYVPEPVTIDGGVLRLFLGSLAGDTSPVDTFTPLLGAEIVLDAGGTIELATDSAYEHGVIVDDGNVELDGTALARAELGYLAPGLTTITLRNTGTSSARVLLLGGPPFGEQVVMWWNFMGRTHEDIEAYRSAWQAGDSQFGTVDGYLTKQGTEFRLPAPELPNARLSPRD
ncbi:pirin family protein [Rhodococcoides yunnanense]|uniref:pirin family protein n=1 Tax=Rhodococcoides yunnanense TaxID=278209 RepID=UPI0014739115|nr:pirin family protein [Rhodococcus yunnanensis]